MIRRLEALCIARYMVMLLGVALFPGTGVATVQAAGFTPTGSMVTAARTLQTATLLPSGKVLITGGISGSDVLNGAELFDPASGTFTTTGSMGTARYHHGATLLTSGKVLITGGDNFSSRVLGSAELYDPQSGAFSRTGDMGTPRMNHTATGLPDGRVLVAGGSPDGIYSDGSMEEYDPVTGSFAPAGELTLARYGHTATLLQDGTVLMAGGLTMNSIGLQSIPTVERYDPAQKTCSIIGFMTTDRAYHTATLLDNGTLLLAGGTQICSGWCNVSPFGNLLAELFDPATGKFTAISKMNNGHVGHAATVLDNGKVLISGGSDNATLFTGGYGELYDPLTATFSVNAPLARGAGSPAVKLQDGRVLVGGEEGTAFLYSFVETTTLTAASTGGFVYIQDYSVGNAAGIMYAPPAVAQSYLISNSSSLIYLPDTTVTLAAPPLSSEGNWFLGWEGCDNATPSWPRAEFRCTVTMGSNRTVTATYAPPVDVIGKLLPARIGTTYFQTLANACTAAFNGAVIEAQGTTFTGELMLDQGFDFAINGGYDSPYSPLPTGMTSLQGKLTVAKGSLKVNRLAVR